jgi:hypothetical protein
MSDYKKVGIDRLGDTLSKELSTYSADVQMGVRLLVDEKSEELKNEIKKNAPVGRRKKYRKSFKVKITNETFRFYEKTVYAAKPENRLTHLLEKTRKKRGKKGGTVQPKVHIAPAAEKIHGEFEAGIKKLIKSSEAMGGGDLSGIKRI